MAAIIVTVNKTKVVAATQNIAESFIFFYFNIGKIGFRNC